MQIEKSENGCWVWLGAKSHNGYADRISDKGIRYRPTHWSILHFKNQIVPNGFHVDHLCKNKICVNPDHLEIVTPSENQRRKHDTSACKRGHLWTFENTYIKPNGKRNCRVCRNLAAKRFHSK